MHATTQTVTPEQRLRAIPMVVGSLMTGIAAFGAVAVLTGPAGSPPGAGQTPPDPAFKNTVLMVLATLLVAAVAGFVAFGVVAKSQARQAWERRADDEDGRIRLLNVLSIHTFIRAALVESVGLFGCVITLMYGDLLPLLAAGISVVLMATLLPARSRLARLEEAASGMRRV